MEQIHTHVADDQYQAAFGTVRAAKNWFWWVVLACLIVQIAGFMLVRFGGIIDAASAVAPTAAPAEGEPAEEQPAEEEPDKVDAEMWYGALFWVFPATKFIAMASGILLAVTLLLAVALTLIGRAGGVPGFVSAFFWSLVLCVFLIPWQQLHQTDFASGALYNLGYLVNHTRTAVWQGGEVSLLTKILYYARFLAYPCLVIFLELIVQAKFARGYRRMILSVTETGPAQPPADAKM